MVKGGRKNPQKEILISNLETSAINPDHWCQDDEENIISRIKNGDLPGPKMSKLSEIEKNGKEG